MDVLSRIAIGLFFAVSTWPVFAADFYWSCPTPIGTRYADATRCDKGDVGVKVMKDGAAPAAPATPAAPAAGVEVTVATGAATVCPNDPAVCKLPDYGVAADTPRAHAIARFMRQKECDFLQRFPKRCDRPQ